MVPEGEVIMKKVSFRVRNFDKEQFLTFDIDNEAELDEELLDFLEDEEPRGIVPVIFEDGGEEQDTFSYNITDKIHLSELSNQEINAEMVLMVMRGIVKSLINMTENRIPLSYLVLHRNYIYIDSDYRVEFICIPLEDMQEEVDVNSFLRNLIACVRFDPSENGDYVAKLLSYVNNPAMFNLRNMLTLIEELMENYGIDIPEDDSSDIYVDYQEVEEKSAADIVEELDDDSEDDFMEEMSADELSDDIDIPIINNRAETIPTETIEDTIEEETVEEPEEAIEEEIVEESEGIIEEEEAEEEPEDIIEEEIVEEPEDIIEEEEIEEPEDIIEEEEIEEPEDIIKEEVIEEPEDILEEEEESDGMVDEDAELDEEAQEIVEQMKNRAMESAHAEDLSEDEEESDKKKGFLKPVFKTKETTITGTVIPDELDEFLAEKEREEQEQAAHHEESNLKIKKNIKVSRASIVKNSQEEQKAAEEAVAESENEESQESKKTEASVANQSAAASANVAVPKSNPYLIRVNTDERIMITKQTFKIGKASVVADYAVKGNAAISRVHATITNKDGVYSIKDNKSTNHTFVNGKIVEDGESVELSDDSKIVLGDEEFIFKLG